jgi:hypothetical protein
LQPASPAQFNIIPLGFRISRFVIKVLFFNMNNRD